MRRVVAVAAGMAALAGVVAVNDLASGQDQGAQVGHVIALPGDGYIRIARRIAPDCPPSGAEIQALWQAISAANGNRPIRAGEWLHYTIGDVPSCDISSTTVVATSGTVAPTTAAPSSTTATLPPTTAPTTSPSTTSPPSTTATSTTSPSTGGDFVARFETEADFTERFTTEVWHRNLSGGNGGINFPAGHHFDATWPGDHNMACEGPATTRTVHASADGSDPESFWWCAPGGPATGHVMVAAGTNDDYSIAAFSPVQTFHNLRSVCWDVNLTLLGDSIWPETTILPAADAAREGLAWHLAEANAYSSATGPIVTTYQQNGVQKLHVGNGNGPTTETMLDGWTVNTLDKATRYRHCITDNGNGTITMTQDRPAGYPRGVRTLPGRFPEHAAVIFSAHIYGGAEKHANGAGITWHFDDVEIDVE